MMDHDSLSDDESWMKRTSRHRRWYRHYDAARKKLDDGVIEWTWCAVDGPRGIHRLRSTADVDDRVVRKTCSVDGAVDIGSVRAITVADERACDTCWQSFSRWQMSRRCIPRFAKRSTKRAR